VVIEDAPAGIQSGKAAGCRVLALRTTTPDPALYAAGADWIVTDASDIHLQPIDGDSDIVMELL
jgi:glycerol 3-phosphatase-1